jgi:predicted transcriptional regulator
MNTMTAATVPMSIRLDATAREKLKAIAVRQKRTPHALATEAIHQLIAQKEREHAWFESCDAALKHFDETGLYATQDEVMAWMDSWAGDKELPTPVCHP